MAKMICPIHNAKLVRCQTQFGGRWGCDSPGCTVRCWEGSTSTPCDQETADVRHAMHQLFDPVWENAGLFDGGRGKRRYRAYRWLSEKMGLPMEFTHFGMFDLGQCEQARRHIVELIGTKETSGLARADSIGD